MTSLNIFITFFRADFHFMMKKNLCLGMGRRIMTSKPPTHTHTHKNAFSFEVFSESFHQLSSHQTISCSAFNGIGSLTSLMPNWWTTDFRIWCGRRLRHYHDWKNIQLNLFRQAAPPPPSPLLFRCSQHFSVETWPPAMPILQSPLHSQTHTQSACPFPPCNQIMLRSLGLIRPFIMDAHSSVNLAKSYEENSSRILSPLMVVRGGTVESLRQSLGKRGVVL